MSLTVVLDQSSRRELPIVHAAMLNTGNFDPPRHGPGPRRDPAAVYQSRASRDCHSAEFQCDAESGRTAVAQMIVDAADPLLGGDRRRKPCRRSPLPY